MNGRGKALGGRRVGSEEARSGGGLKEGDGGVNGTGAELSGGGFGSE